MVTPGTDLGIISNSGPTSKMSSTRILCVPSIRNIYLAFRGSTSEPNVNFLLFFCVCMAQLEGAENEPGTQKSFRAEKWLFSGGQRRKCVPNTCKELPIFIRPLREGILAPSPQGRQFTQRQGKGAKNKNSTKGVHYESMHRVIRNHYVQLVSDELIT